MLGLLLGQSYHVFHAVYQRLTLDSIVDLHSHVGGSNPALRGSDDGNSYKGPITPWLRVLDGLNTHDLSV